MADQTLSPSGSPAKIGIPAKAVPGKRAVIYTRVSTGDQHAETQLYDLRELAKQRRICSMPLLDESRKRFLAKFFVVGACAPAVWGLSEVFGWVLYSVYFVTFPTQVIFLDAEHLPEILFSLVIAAPMNGAWYVFCSDSFLAFA
jgi:hypothetical protein